MEKFARVYALAVVVLCLVLVRGELARAQDAQTTNTATTPVQAPAPAPASSQQAPEARPPCIQPPPMVSWQDYNGKFQKVVGAFGRRIERKSVRSPRYKPGVKLCTLETKDKFWLFVNDSVDPITFAGVAFDAGLDQAENTDPTFGQGAAGYGQRFGAEFAGQASGEFFGVFAYPAIFSEDPRYYRLGEGSTARRLFHAMGHVVIAKRVDGSNMFNISNWLGTASEVALSNTYHPGNRRGFAPAAETVGFSFAQSMGFDVLREFWPEVARKLRLPFRGEQSLAGPGAAAARVRGR